MTYIEFRTFVRQQRRITLPPEFEEGDIVEVEVRKLIPVKEGIKNWKKLTAGEVENE